MDKATLKRFILNKLQSRLKLFDINEAEIKDSFDFVKSGLLDSMAFVDLLSSIEKEFDMEIDFEEFIDKDGFTTFKGLADNLLEQYND